MRKVLLVLVVLLTVLAMASPTLANPTASNVIHIVRPGDTLFSIARTYGVDMWTLARVNGIVNPNYIYVGQHLIIPSAAPSPPTGAGVYVVKAGDTLYGIAARYGVTAWAIAQANGIYNINTIYVGQPLTIPGLAPTPKPSAATGWRGEYYKGTDPRGGPLFVRTDSAINFHWGLSAPDTRLDTDRFSVRWARTITFKGGLYRFTVTVDDGVRLWVDSGMVLDAWKVQPETTYKVDVVLSPGAHTITLEYFEDTGVATIQFSFARLGDAPVVTPTPGATPTPRGGTAIPTEGWLAQFYGNAELSGPVILSRIDPYIGFEWKGASPGSGIPENYFSARWVRKASFANDNYRFCAMSDDGVRLYVDGKLVIDEWHGSNGLSYCGMVDLTEGVHEVKVEYFQHGGNALIYVWWERW